MGINEKIDTSFLSLDQEEKEDIKNYFRNRELPDFLPDDKESIEEIRASKNTILQKKKDIALAVIDHLRYHGLFFYTKDLHFYYFLNSEKELLDMAHPIFALLLHQTFGLNKNTSEYEFIIFELQAYIYNQWGYQTTIHNICYYDKAKYILYIHNNDNIIYKITSESIEKHDNGVDGILFLKNLQADSWSAKLDNYKQDDDDFIFNNPNFAKDSYLKPIEAKAIFKAWFYYSFFMDNYPTRPILSLIGEKGSAKTMSLKLIKALVYGLNKKEVYTFTDNKREAEDYVASNFFHFFDNQDNKIFGRNSWIEDFLAVLSTGFELERRKLYTDSQIWSKAIKGIPAITSRTPYFKRDDVADRLLILELERITDFITESELYATLEDKRNSIWACILNNLKDTIHSLQTNSYKNRITFRLSDFAHFLYSTNSETKPIDKLLKKLTGKQNEFTLEENPIYQALLIFLENTFNNDTFFTTKALFKELSQIANENHIEDFPKTTISFGKRLRNILSNLSNEIKVKQDTARSRVKLYSFQLQLS